MREPKRILIRDGRHVVTMYKDGQIIFEDPVSHETLLASNAAELMYVLDRYQEEFDGIPVKLDWASFRTLRG